MCNTYVIIYSSYVLLCVLYQLTTLQSLATDLDSFKYPTLVGVLIREHIDDA